MSDEKIRGTSRRQFLGWSSAAGGAALFSALGGAGSDPALLDALADRVDPNVTQTLFGFTATVRRPQDQLLLKLSTFNIDVDLTQTPPVLTKKQATGNCFLIVGFGATSAPTPMHVAEQAFTLSGTNGQSGKKELPTQNKAPTKQGSGNTVNAAPVGSRIAGGSQLVFFIPDDMLAPVADTPLTLTTADILNWVNLALSVVPNAVPPFGSVIDAPAGIGAPRAPTGLETAIELPYNLIISPPANWTTGPVDPREHVAFVNTINPVTSKKGWTELWHTRLATTLLEGGIDQLLHVVVDETNRDLRTVRAIWCTDGAATDMFADDLAANKSGTGDDGDPPFDQKALKYGDRYDIVRLSSDFTRDNQGGPYLRAAGGTARAPAVFIPSPAKVDRLMLTSLGAWLDCDAHWDLPPYKTGKNKPSVGYSSSLLAWRQRTVQARDTYVRIVRKGYLFPWGHKASLVTVTERQFAEKSGSVGAYLRQRTFIVVVEPTKNYNGNDSIPHAGRNVPFTDAEILTHVTPDLDQPVPWTKKQNGDAELVFQPTLNGQPFRFHLRGTDWAGDPIDMRSAVLWVDDTIAYNDSATQITGVVLQDLITAMFSNWNKSANAPARTIDLHGQRVSMARARGADDPKGPAPTQLVLGSLDLGADLPKTGVTAGHLIDTSQPTFFPALNSAEVHLPEASTLSGNNVSSSTMAYHGKYLNSSTFPKGGVFLKTTGIVHEISFKGDKAGGALTPNLSITGYSREIGPASGNLDHLSDGTFNPAEVFGNVDAKLLGGITLQDILSDAVENTTFGDGDNDNALQMTSVEKRNPRRVVTVLDWHPSIQEGGSTPDGGHIFIPTGDVDNSMDLHALIVTQQNQSTAIVTGEIRDFELHLFGDNTTQFIIIPFDSLQFRSETGKKTDVKVDVSDGGVQFKGALEFVQDLADALNFGGSGLTVDTAGDAITATLTLAIPSLAVGVFALENLAFNAGVAIPYNGDPVRFDFSFCSRENPFQLEIMIFTGGGFVGLGIGADGVELLEFSFDFGLGFSIDIGIAKGSVSLTGGVYFECEQEANGSEDIDLTAYVKASGGISALGLVSVSVELYLGLEYQSSGGESQLAGDAEMSISVHIIFFGFTIGFSVHEEFAGSSSAAAITASGARQQRALAGLATAADWVDPMDPNGPATSLITTMSADGTDWERYCTSFALVGVGV